MSNLDECAASGHACDYVPAGLDGELQCRDCGKPAPVYSVLPIETIRYHVMVACRDNWNPIQLARVLEHAVVSHLERCLSAELAVIEAAAKSRPMDDRERQYLDGAAFGIRTMRIYTRGARPPVPSPADAAKP